MRLNIFVALLGCFCLVQLVQASSFRQTFSAIFFVVLASLPSASPPYTFVVARNDAFVGCNGTFIVGRNDTFHVLRSTTTIKQATPTTKKFLQTVELRGTCQPLAPVSLLPENTSITHEVRDYGPSPFGPAHVTISAPRPDNVSLIDATGLLLNTTAPVDLSHADEAEIYPLSVYGTTRGELFRSSEKLSRIGEAAASIILRIFACIDAAQAATALSIRSTTSATINTVLPLCKDLHTSFTILWKSKPFRCVASAFLVIGAEAVALAWVYKGNVYGREGSWLRTSTNGAQTLIYLLSLSVYAIAILPIEMFRETGPVRLAIGLFIATINLVYSLLCQVPAWAWLSLIFACFLVVDVIRVALTFTEMTKSTIITAKLGCLSAVAMVAVYFLWPYCSLFCGCFHHIFVVSKKFCFACDESMDCARKLYILAFSYTCEDDLDSASFSPASASLDICDSENERPLPFGRLSNDYQTWDRPNRPWQTAQVRKPCAKLLPLCRKSFYNASRPRRIALVSPLPPPLQMLLAWHAIHARKQFLAQFSPPVTTQLPPILALPAPDSDPHTPQAAAPNADVNTTICLPSTDIGNVPQPVVSDSTTSLLADSAASDPIVDCQLTIPSARILNAPTPLQATDLTLSPFTITATMTPLTQLMDYKHTGSAENLLEGFEYEPTDPAKILVSPDMSSNVVDSMVVEQDAIVADEEPMVIYELNKLAGNVTASSALLPQSISTYSPFSGAPHLPPRGNTPQQTPFPRSTAGGFLSNAFPSSNRVPHAPVVGPQIFDDIEMAMGPVPGPTLGSLPGASLIAPQPPPSASRFMTPSAQSQPASFLVSAPSNSFNTNSSHFQASSTAPSSSTSMPGLGNSQNGNAPLLPSSNAFEPIVGPFEVVMCNLPMGTTAKAIIPLVKEVSRDQFPFTIKSICNEGRQVHVVLANETLASFVHGNFDKMSYIDAARKLRKAVGVSDTGADRKPPVQVFWKGAPAPGTKPHLYHGVHIGEIPTKVSSAHIEASGTDLNIQKDGTQHSSQTFNGTAGALGPGNSALKPPFSHLPPPVASSPVPLSSTGTTWRPPPQTSSWQQSPFSQSAPVVAPQPQSLRSTTSDDVDMEDIAAQTTNVVSNPITTGQPMNLPLGRQRLTTASSPLSPSASGQPRVQSFTGGAGAPGVPQSVFGHANTQNQLPAQTTSKSLGSTWDVPLIGVSGGFCKLLPAVTPVRKPTSNGVNPNFSKAVSNPAKISNPPTTVLASSQSSTIKQAPPANPFTTTITQAPPANPFTTAVADLSRKHLVIVRGLIATQTKAAHSDWCYASVGITPVSVRMIPGMGGETVEFTFADEQQAKSLCAFANNNDRGISSRILGQDEVQKKISQPAVLPPPAIKGTPSNFTKKSTVLAESVRASDNAPTFKTEGTSRYSQVAVSAFDPDSDEDDALAWADEMTPSKRVAACHLEDGEDGRVAIFSFTTKVHADQFKMAVNAEPWPYPKPRAIAREPTSAQPAAAPSTPSTPLSEPKPAIVEKARTKANVVEISNMDDQDEEKQKRHLVDAIARLNTENAVPYLARRSGENGTVAMRLEFDSVVIANAIVEHLERHFCDGTNWGADLLKQRPVFRQLRTPKKVPKKV